MRKYMKKNSKNSCKLKRIWEYAETQLKSADLDKLALSRRAKETSISKVDFNLAFKIGVGKSVCYRSDISNQATQTLTFKNAKNFGY